MQSSSRIRLDLETERLNLRPWTAGDTSWHRYLAGERGRGTASARRVLEAAKEAHALDGYLFIEGWTRSILNRMIPFGLMRVFAY